MARPRIVLHHDSTCAIVACAAVHIMLERFFGATITLTTGRVVPVRLIGEQHVREDLGFIPSFADWVRCIRPQVWMGRAQPIHRDVDPFVSGLPSQPAES
jgi:hypothetical protein